ncbi:hypothetical protein QYF36_017644 [Acer negundo]|nr:hypothetical protein QYF36_017644 [Acer negundo]
MKSKTKRLKRNLGLATTFIFCCFFFLAGFYGSTLLSQDAPRIRPRLRMLELENTDGDELMMMPHGKIGEPSIQSISFQAFNVLRYEIGQKYDSHYNAFNPNEYGPQTSQRMASFLLYLSDIEEGGETMFPFEGGSNMNSGYDFRKCIGLKVKPRRGDGLLFYSLFPNGTIDQTSLHGSCPVIKGEKWVATKWIRDQVQED